MAVLSKSRARYDPAQPRHPSGKREGGRWRSSAEGYLPSKLGEKAAAFEAAGGTISNVQAEEWPRAPGTSELEERIVAIQTIEQMSEMLPPEWIQEKGTRYTESAIQNSTSNVFIAYGPENMGGGIAGALSWFEMPEEYPLVPLSATGDRTWIVLEYLGTTGLVDGTGSALIAQVMREAASRGAEITFEPDDDAIPFYERLGATEDPWDTGSPGNWGWTRDSIRALVDEL